MLKFLTHKLRTHSLNEEHPHQKIEDDDHDSGTESDDEHGATEEPDNNMESEGGSVIGVGVGGIGEASIVTPASPYFLDSALPSDSDLNYDHHSSEEELEVINSSQHNSQELARSRSASTVPEKRKWSQPHRTRQKKVINIYIKACTEKKNSELPTVKWENKFYMSLNVMFDSIFGIIVKFQVTPEVVNPGPPRRLSHRQISGSVSLPRCELSSGSSDEEVQGLLAAMATPVQFRTSPPRGAHRPGHRSLSPPPKLFHYVSSPAHDSAASPRKRHRHAAAPSPHAIQRPCLDFEKMQQLKARAVTAWRHSGEHGGELSVFCW